MTIKTLTATPATIRKIRTFVRHGNRPEEISARMLCGLAPLKKFCRTHQIDLEPIDGGNAEQNPTKTGAAFDRRVLAPVTFSLVIERGAYQAIDAEAVKRGTTNDKLCAEILRIVATPHERGDNLFSAVLDY